MTTHSEQTTKVGRYDPAAIEPRWQLFWEEQQTFRVGNPGETGTDPSKPKYYILDMFPYPSGAGLHVGHPVGYCATDIVARYKRMKGFNVLRPMGFDAFGLPAEQYAVETNVHPAVTTKKNIDIYRRQLKTFGFSYDWNREIATCDPSYYKHTQWMFSRMFDSWYDASCRWTAQDGTRIVGKARAISELVEELEAGRLVVDASLKPAVPDSTKQQRAWGELSESERERVVSGQRLAYIDEIPVNWCPALGTVLANEEVDAEGRSDRGGHPVFRRPLRQWLLRITKYAERLLGDLDELDWPEAVKLMQRNWVGRSTGAEVVFPLADHWRVEGGRWVCSDGAASLSCDQPHHAIKVYTTRPDTLFGATYVVLAPEHELVEQVTTDEQRSQVDQYVEAAQRKSDMSRTTEVKEKTGVFTGAYAINPVSAARIPIWIADYVLMGYGTGAIMAVPGGDARDFEFARAFDLPIVSVVKPPTDWVEQRLETLASGIDEAATKGFDRIAAEVPELSTEIAQRRERSTGLGAKTLETLRNSVGLERLADHVVKHPKAWGDAYSGEGVAVNSPAAELSASVPGGACELNGLSSGDATVKIVAWLEAAGVGRATVNYKLRDWLFSRQRYWGEPFPVLHGESGETRLVADEDLPVELPEMEDFRPTPSAETSESVPAPPLSRAGDWITVEQDGQTFRRDLNTMPQWAGSCWYYLRFIDPHNADRFCGSDAERYWMPVDLYVGGAEHAVLHLLYARFWHKVLFDLGWVSTREPFRKLFNQGMIQGFAFRDQRGMIVGPDAVEERGEDRFVLKASGEVVTRVIAKMSKSLKNVVSPDEIIGRYGADTFRMYEMFMGPLDSAKPWNTRDVPGLHKLCQRIWRLYVDEVTGSLSAAVCDDPPDEKSLRALHKVIKRVTEDIEAMKFNTAIAAIFDFVNTMTPQSKRSRVVLEPFVLVMSPFAPHLGEELWARLGHAESLAYEPWPSFDPKYAHDEEVEIAIQINGKLRARVMMAADADSAATELAAMADAKIGEAIAGKTVRKVIVVVGRLVNILVS
ncbi:MAG: leucine--tRNA ligase [Planctomycetes bacterium]|nr:leucine--tRNA ligase [Planctomycetota bacterium]